MSIKRKSPYMREIQQPSVTRFFRSNKLYLSLGLKLFPLQIFLPFLSLILDIVLVTKIYQERNIFSLPFFCCCLFRCHATVFVSPTGNKVFSISFFLRRNTGKIFYSRLCNGRLRRKSVCGNGVLWLCLVLGKRLRHDWAIRQINFARDQFSRRRNIETFETELHNGFIEIARALHGKRYNKW